jgi:hypothetical protein
MKRIYTSSALAIMLMISNVSNSQPVTSASCTTIGEDFETDPIPRGFEIQNFTWVGIRLQDKASEPGQHFPTPSTSSKPH